MMKKLSREFFSKDAAKVAKNLLGKILVRKLKGKELKARITETEAYYGKKDPASRARQNGNLREVMLDKPGTILVYGIHQQWLINFVTGKKRKAEAVLLREVEPLNFKKRTRGPGLLTKALAIDKGFHGKDICSCKELWLERAKEKEKFEVFKAKRIGVKEDLPRKLRFYINSKQV